MLALADLYKEPIDGLSVDHVVQEITHKDMCHSSHRHEWRSYLPVTRLESCDKERLGILHYEKLTGHTAAAAAAAALSLCFLPLNTRSCLTENIVEPEP